MTDVPQTLVITGVSGSGKTTVGTSVAERTGATFLDADDFHPPTNVAKMAEGVPLDDGDREPWIDALVAELDRRAGRGEAVVLACSALRRRHRERLRHAADDVVVVHLDVRIDELRDRLERRGDHFMPASLLDSQLDDLELPDPERTIVVDGDGPPDRVVEEVLRRVGRS